jgi:hypothetical protein
VVGLQVPEVAISYKIRFCPEARPRSGNRETA